MFAALIALVIYPPCRPLLFPPAPIALVDKDTGGVQRPQAGVLGSHDSITGAPERFKGEAVEQEASNLVAGVASVAVGSALGKHDQGVPDDAPLEEALPDAMDIVAETADAHTAAQGWLRCCLPEFYSVGCHGCNHRHIVGPWKWSGKIPTDQHLVCHVNGRRYQPVSRVVVNGARQFRVSVC